MKKKIGIIDTLGAHGGSFHLYTFGQAMGLIKNGVSVNLYTNNETDNPNIPELGFYSFYINIFKSKYNFINGLRWIFGSLISILHARISGISIFHFHIFYTNFLILFNVLLVKLLFGKIVLTIHDVTSFAEAENNKPTIINKLVYRISNLILTHNKFSLEEINKRNSKIYKKIIIIPHGNFIPFISNDFDMKFSREYLKIPLDKKVLLFFGMIKKVKGLEILLKSLKEVIHKHPNVLLVIAGRVWENDFSTYQNIIDKNNLNDYCIIHNRYIPQNEVGYYYKSADLVVLPYKKIYQSGVLMMSLSYEVPVLVSDLPPLMEIINDNENGFLFDSENINSLSDKLLEILSNKDLLDKVKLKGTEIIKNEYNWIKIGSMTCKAYKSIY